MIKKISLLILIIAIIMPSVYSIGIVWYTESDIINEGETKCLLYGAYNPSANDATVTIDLSGELKNVVSKYESEEKLVKARTKHDNAVEIEFCFTMPKVYEEDCLIGSFLCEQTCQEDPVSYKGEVILTDIGAKIGGATGSAPTIAAASPLSLTVNCNQHPRDWTLVYIILILIILIVIASLIYNKYKVPSRVRKERKLQRLQEELGK